MVLATVAFAWQIYFDFSGYTDMARGIARVMGFRMMLNFNTVYGDARRLLVALAHQPLLCACAITFILRSAVIAKASGARTSICS